MVTNLKTCIVTGKDIWRCSSISDIQSGDLALDSKIP